MIKEFYNLDEIQKYYDKESNTYIFKEYGTYINLVVFNFDLNVKSNIYAWNIYARNINALNIHTKSIKADDIVANEDIKAWDIYAKNIKANNIEAWNIYADDISYWAVCFAIYDIKCKSIKGRRENHKHFVLDGKLEVLEND